jgi:hypothetical protein
MHACMHTGTSAGTHPSLALQPDSLKEHLTIPSPYTSFQAGADWPSTTLTHFRELWNQIDLTPLSSLCDLEQVLKL